MAAFLLGCLTGLIVGAGAVVSYGAYTFWLGFKRIKSEKEEG